MFLLFQMSGFGQTDTIITDGYKVFYYPNGKKSSEGKFINGKPEGIWKSYYENEKLKSEGERKNNQPEGLWKFYSDAGVLVSEYNYTNGKKNGLQRTFYADGKLKTEEQLKDNIREGWFKEYGENGKVISETPFKNGVEEGIAKEYAEDGRIVTITHYSEGYVKNVERINRIDKFGLKQGIWKTFYSNEKIKSEAQYLDDKLNGFYKEYSEDGTLTKNEKYKNGEPVVEKQNTAKLELERNFYPNGKLKSIVNVIEGKKEGTEKFFDENGKVTSAKLYQDNKLAGEGMMDDNYQR